MKVLHFKIKFDQLSLSICETESDKCECHKYFVYFSWQYFVIFRHLHVKSTFSEKLVYLSSFLEPSSVIVNNTVSSISNRMFERMINCSSAFLKILKLLDWNESSFKIFKNHEGQFIPKIGGTKHVITG